MSKNFWETNAENWNQVIESGIFKSRQITNAAIINEIQRHQFGSLLDVGCGEGWIAGALDLKKIDYLGIDGSAGLIEKARLKYKAQFEKVDYTSLTMQSWSPNRKFDGIVFNFSLLEEDISGLLQSIKEYLQPKGLILIQTLHPCFALSDYRDEWNSEDFKSSGIQFSAVLPWFGRTLGTWTRVFARAGLTVQEVVEPMNDGKPASIVFMLKA